jgi:hypothetical protein
MSTLKLMRKVKSAFRYGCKSHLYLARYLELRKEELEVIRAGKLSKRGPKKVFNLDLHIGVIPDIAEELNIQGVLTTQWSISLSNALVDGRRPIPDPVRHINSRKWHLLDKDRIRNFQKRYGKFLANFDGFVCTYPPTFAELFENLNKPILVLSATRYETPYSESPQAWHRFNSHLVSGVKSGQISLYSNNKGDSDYLNFFTGLTAPISPSLCRKTLSQKGTNGKRIIISKDERLADKFERETQGFFRKISSLGSPYSWSDLASCEEILVLPQNISTMTLFELATAGVPVAVPGPRWIKSLIDQGFSILGELTFHQLLNLPVQEHQKSSPVDYLSSDYLDWWLSRADFYDKNLMPNVRVVNGIEELITGETKRLTTGDAYSKVIAERNMKIENTRRDMVRHFIEKM